MRRVDRGRYLLPDEERKRTLNILQRALNVENGMDIPDPRQLTMDGGSYSRYTGPPVSLAAFFFFFFHPPVTFFFFFSPTFRIASIIPVCCASACLVVFSFLFFSFLPYSQRV